MYGTRLKSLRLRNGYTIEGLCEELDLKRSTYAKYERKERKPPIELILKFARHYGVSTDYIFGLTDDQDIKELEHNASEYLKKNDLHYKGVPLTEEELKPIRDLFEVVVRDRIPKDK